MNRGEFVCVAFIQEHLKADSVAENGGYRLKEKTFSYSHSLTKPLHHLPQNPFIYVLPIPNTTCQLAAMKELSNLWVSSIMCV